MGSLLDILFPFINMHLTFLYDILKVLSDLFICCIYKNAHTNHNTRVEVKGQISGVGSLPLPCGSWGLNLGRRACQQAPYPTEPPL